MFILHRLLAVGFSLAFAASVLAAPNRPLVQRRPVNVRAFHHHRHHRRHHVHRRAVPNRRHLAVAGVRRHFNPIVKHRSARHRPAHRHHRR